ncbi:MAG TPA: enoyl-CoA hydratase-related protein [Dehalococcoidia bacterium]|nr:enoyl-CoA hydratase-related protein [Dehalococcoidia bacterium]
MSSVTLDLTPPIARLTFVDHAVGADEVRDIVSAVQSLADDESVRVIIVATAGGWDKAAIGSREAAIVSGILSDPFGALATVSKPVICVVDGEVSGGSLALALAADIRVAGQGAAITFDDVAAGRVPVAGTTQRLARLVGRGNALDVVLSGRAVDAAEAMRIGLVSEVATDPHQRVGEIASRIAERGPVAVAYAKEVIVRGVEMPLEQALRYETDLTVILQTTEDRAEGVEAFLSKRKPEFKGR